MGTELSIAGPSPVLSFLPPVESATAQHQKQMLTLELNDINS